MIKTFIIPVSHFLLDLFIFTRKADIRKEGFLSTVMFPKWSQQPILGWELWFWEPGSSSACSTWLQGLRILGHAPLLSNKQGWKGSTGAQISVHVQCQYHRGENWHFDLLHQSLKFFLAFKKFFQLYSWLFYLNGRVPEGDVGRESRKRPPRIPTPPPPPLQTLRGGGIEAFYPHTLLVHYSLPPHPDQGPTGTYVLLSSVNDIKNKIFKKFKRLFYFQRTRRGETELQYAGSLPNGYVIWFSSSFFKIKKKFFLFFIFYNFFVFLMYF